MPVEVTVAGHAAAPADVAFDAIMPIDLAAIFARFLLIPGVAGVRDQSGPWDTAGRSRTVVLTDGTAAPERLTRVERPHGFGYEVGPFPRPLGLLVARATGEWRFDAAPGGGTDIRWTYGFAPQRGRATVVRGIVGPMWRGYAVRALARAIAAADRAMAATPAPRNGNAPTHGLF